MRQWCNSLALRSEEFGIVSSKPGRASHHLSVVARGRAISALGANNRTFTVAVQRMILSGGEKVNVNMPCRELKNVLFVS